MKGSLYRKLVDSYSKLNVLIFNLVDIVKPQSLGFCGIGGLLFTAFQINPKLYIRLTQTYYLQKCEFSAEMSV